MKPEDPGKIDRWLEQLATEIVLAEPGTDHGLLPIRELLSNLSGRTAAVAELAGFHAVATHALHTVDAIFDNGATWQPAHLDALSGLFEQLKEARHNPAFTFSPPAPTGTTEAAPTAPSAPAPAAEEPLVVNLEADADLLKEFLTEAAEHLQNIEQGILVLEENPGDKDTLNTIFRAFHTFKGTSGFLRLVPINRLAHELETLLDLARQEKLLITRDVIDLILEGGDALKAIVGEVGNILTGRRPAEPVPTVVQPLVQRVKQAIASQEQPAAPVARKAPAPQPAPTATATPAPAAAPAAAPAPVATQAPVTPPAPAAAPAPVAQAQPASAEPANGAKKGGASRLTDGAGVVKVDTFKLDSLMDLVGELVIAQSQVAQDSDLRQHVSQKLGRNLAQLTRIVNELQRTAMSLRMVPVRGTFQKMGRLVRDLSVRVGKRIELQTHGEETELDRGITEELADPLMHMIRNSIDHGIETPDKRRAAGKAESGIITLKAYHQGGNIVIEIADDGAGLPKDKILRKAREKGIVPANVMPTDDEIYHLIFAPGFSTAEQVTDISGRGVGMDVVRRNIEKLRGKIEISTAPGQGTTFKIFLPLTLAIIDGLILMVGEQRFIVPTLAVRESFRPARESISTVHERGEVVNVRGSLVPLLRLYDHLGLKPRSEDPAESIILVVESAQARRCILVDDLVGKQEVVIKSLGEQFKASSFLAGAAILGDGQVGLILEPHALATLGRN